VSSESREQAAVLLEVAVAEEQGESPPAWRGASVRLLIAVRESPDAARRRSATAAV
jgi:hypothetical protein